MASSSVFALAPAWDRWFGEYVCGGAGGDEHDTTLAGDLRRSLGNDRSAHAHDAPFTATREEDIALVTRVRDGDVTAYTELFRAYYPSLISFLRKYLDTTSDCEDLAQDTMMRLWERRATLDPRRSIRAFLFTVARHRALDHLGHRRHTLKYVAQVQQMNGPSFAAVSADAEAIAHELDRIAARYVGQLPPRQREIFQLSRGEGLSPPEIAALLGIATSTVYVQLAKIAKSLHDVLSAWITE